MEPTFEINGVNFLLVDTGNSVVSEDIPSSQTQTFSVFTVYRVKPGLQITGSNLSNFRATALDPDDVFQPQFLHHILFTGCEETQVEWHPSANAVLDAWGVKKYTFTCIQDTHLDPGPYVSYLSKIWQPWRIYDDKNLTMVTTFKPKGPLLTCTSGHHTSSEELDNYSSPGAMRVVVPSRSYYGQESPDKPLLGWRIAVKDMFDISGSQTTLCNRAWGDFHGVKSTTASSIRRLQDLGACIVGKTRLNAMLVREETMECVEFLAPFNPRGDGYQTSSGSSSGSCAALGAYPWIDFAIGSDTNGSCRKPAYWNGCYAVRPTHGVLSTDGVASFCPYYDVPTFFGRDLGVFHKFADLWYGGSSKLNNSASLTKDATILYPTDYLPTNNAEQMKIIDAFVSDLEAFLGVKRTPISLAEEWRKTGAETPETADLSKYLETAATLPYYKDAIEIVKEWTDKYREQHGRSPFIHRALRWRWEMADKLTPEERDEGWSRIYKYREWLLTHVLKAATIVILPLDEGKPNYRDASPPAFGLLSGYHPLYLSPIAGSPEITLPIGEIPYISGITHQKESLPISVSVVSSPGTDLPLIDLVHDALLHANRPVVLKTGRQIL
ncbi:amidase [Diaporthe sp. PMI_573]|nr:amidase [Diaporthaceae sp. PMI_573]